MPNQMTNHNDEDYKKNEAVPDQGEEDLRNVYKTH